MTSSSGAEFTASGRGSTGSFDVGNNSEYHVLLPELPTGVAVLNSVLLHEDVSARPYRASDFKEPLEDAGVLQNMVPLGACQMNHVWLLTLKSLAAKHQLLQKGELQVKGRKCLILDPNLAEIRAKVHWTPFHAPDGVLRLALEPYKKVVEVVREKWQIEGFEGVETTTRTVWLTLKEGVTLQSLPHQLRVFSGNILVVASGRASQCLRCKRTGHVRRDSRS